MLNKRSQIQKISKTKHKHQGLTDTCLPGVGKKVIVIKIRSSYYLWGTGVIAFKGVRGFWNADSTWLLGINH
jgi:hypothetical protein